MRNAHLIDDSSISNLVTFSLPTTWIAAAKVSLLILDSMDFNSYEFIGRLRPVPRKALPRL